METYKIKNPKATSLLPVSAPNSLKNLAPSTASPYDPGLRLNGVAPVLQHMERQEQIFLMGGPRPQTMNPFGDNLMSYEFPSSRHKIDNSDYSRGNEFAWSYPIQKRLEYGVEVPLVQTGSVTLKKESPFYPEPGFKESKSKDFYTYPYFKKFNKEGQPIMKVDTYEFFSTGISLAFIFLVVMLILIVKYIIYR